MPIIEAQNLNDLSFACGFLCHKFNRAVRSLVKPSYDDGIKAWLDGEYINFSFLDENIKKIYKKSFILAL
ncbi:MAG: hypothetical protein CSB21_03280 [Deltaproteobacteria bacterium]|nr:MAG: hypothetical protein CSB21_03280 [Deltaproteobacteria bacterium]